MARPKLKDMKSLLGVFVAAVLYFVIVQHVTNLYATEHHAVERFILVDGGIYTFLFWAGTILVGGLLPLAVVYHPTLGKSRQWIGIACAMVIAGGMATIYVIVIGGQAFPLPIFPDKEIIESSFFDGVVGSYTPSLPEILLGIGGVAVSAAVVAVAAKVLPFLPESLSDEVVDASVS